MHKYVDTGFNAHWSRTLVSETGVQEPPFSPVVRTSGITIYISGQTYPAIGSRNTTPAAEVNLKEQTRASLENIDLLVRAGGGTRTDIVKVTIYSTRMDQQDDVNDVYLDFFSTSRPTRTHVEVTRLADPNLLIEIEAIAVVES